MDGDWEGGPSSNQKDAGNWQKLSNTLFESLLRRLGKLLGKFPGIHLTNKWRRLAKGWAISIPDKH